MLTDLRQCFRNSLDCQIFLFSLPFPIFPFHFSFFHFYFPSQAFTLCHSLYFPLSFSLPFPFPLPYSGSISRSPLCVRIVLPFLFFISFPVSFPLCATSKVIKIEQKSQTIIKKWRESVGDDDSRQT